MRRWNHSLCKNSILDDLVHDLILIPWVKIKRNFILKFLLKKKKFQTFNF